MANLMDPSVNIEGKIAAVKELKNSIEAITSSPEYNSYLRAILPSFIQLFLSASGIFQPQIINLKNLMLEIVHRFPHNEALKIYARELMIALITVLKSDSEGNAVLSLKIIVDLHKNYKSLVEDQVQPLMDVVLTMYSNMHDAVRMAFSVPKFLTQDENPDGTLDQNITTSMYSFKVLTECPVIVALLFSLHRSIVPINVNRFVPLIVNVKNY